MKKFLLVVMSIVSLGLNVAWAEGEAATEETTESKSQAINASNYNAETKVLTIVFERGTYNYAEVPADVYEAFKTSDSQGTFYRNEIKGKYASTKVEEAGSANE